MIRRHWASSTRSSRPEADRTVEPRRYVAWVFRTPVDGASTCHRECVARHPVHADDDSRKRHDRLGSGPLNRARTHHPCQSFRRRDLESDQRRVDWLCVSIMDHGTIKEGGGCGPILVRPFLLITLLQLTEIVFHSIRRFGELRSGIINDWPALPFDKSQGFSPVNAASCNSQIWCMAVENSTLDRGSLLLKEAPSGNSCEPGVVEQCCNKCLQSAVAIFLYRRCCWVDSSTKTTKTHSTRTFAELPHCSN